MVLFVYLCRTRFREKKINDDDNWRHKAVRPDGTGRTLYDGGDSRTDALAFGKAWPDTGPSALVGGRTGARRGGGFRARSGPTATGT